MTQETIAVIDLANLTVEFFTDTVTAAAHADKIDGYQATSAEGLNDLSGPQAVALYNVTAKELDTGLTEVKRFADKGTASKRLWANLQDLAEARAANARVARVEASAKNKPVIIANKARDGAAPAKNSDYPAPASASKPKKVAASKPVAPRRGSGINLAPLNKAYACRAGSKQAILVDILFRPQGATMPELLEALSGGSKPWLEVSVKSGMNWDMNKVKGYGIRTSKRGDEDCYHLVLPEGLTAPVPHTVKKGA